MHNPPPQHSKLPPDPRLLLLLLHLLPLLPLLPCISAHPPDSHLITPLIDCPCTFKVSRSSSDNTPFSIIVLTPERRLHLRSHLLTRQNLTNHLADYKTSTTAFFYIRIHHKARNAIAIRSATTNQFKIRHTAHTVCPILLEPHPPGLFRQNIVGGSSASPDLRRYLAYLYSPRTGRACSGTVIAPKWIITAAHCGITSRHIAYLRGESARQGTPYSINRVYSHQLFDEASNPQFDIAVVKLAKPALDAHFMRVSINPRIPLATSAARVLGYGTVSHDSPNDAVLLGQLRQVDVPIVTHAQCLAVYSFISELLQVCAGYFGRGGCDSCQGDSGGPLIQYDFNGKPVLVGVVSRGRFCGEARYPGIYIRIGAFESWLDSIVDVYRKANSTRAVLAVTRSSSATFSRLLVPVIAVCGGVLALGVTILLIFKIRQRKQRNDGLELEKSGDDTGSGYDIDGTKQWQDERSANTGMRQDPVEDAGQGGFARTDEHGRNSGGAANSGRHAYSWSLVSSESQGVADIHSQNYRNGQSSEWSHSLAGEALFPSKGP